MNLIIPMAGKGTRLRPHTLSTPKPLIEIAGKTIIERIVDNMSVEDLVEYVAMDLDKYYDDMLDPDFLAEAEDYWEDYFPDIIQEIQEDF